MMIVGITYGTFDLLHYGHLKLLNSCKKRCDFLVVFVSTDEFNAVKGKKSVIEYEVRSKTVAELPMVDLVFPEESWGQKIRDIKQQNATYLFMGDDWKGVFDNLSEKCETIYFPYTKDISSTQIRGKIYDAS